MKVNYDAHVLYSVTLCIPEVVGVAIATLEDTIIPLLLLTEIAVAVGDDGTADAYCKVREV